MTCVLANPATFLPKFWSIPSEVGTIPAKADDFFDYLDKKSAQKRSTFGDIDLAALQNDFSSLKSLFDQLSEDQLHPVSQ